MSTRAVNTALVAGFFAVLGAVITLLYQELSGHNANRREDSRRCYEVAAELMAAAHKVILTLPIADGSSDGAMTAGEASKSVATDDAFYQFDSVIRG